MDDSELATTFGPAVYRVEASGCEAVSIGTAFAVDEHHLVTNQHVVAIDTAPQLVAKDGIRLAGEVIGWSTDHDIALIEVAASLPMDLDWADATDLGEGDRLVVLGYPRPTHSFAVAPGSIQSFPLREDASGLVEIDVSVDYGNSGGPALTREGLVAGVVSAVDPNEGGLRNIPLMLRVDLVLEVVDRLLMDPNEVQPDCASAVGPVGSGDIARQLAGCEAACPIQIPTLEGETPPFPEAIDGFRNDGLIASEEIRVFPNDALTAPINFEWADHGCTWVWTARWRVIDGPDVVGVAVPPYHSDPNDLVGFYWPDPGSDSVTWSELMGDTEPPPSSSAGFLAGSICELPAWISPVENGNVLTDIVVDWIYWTPAP